MLLDFLELDHSDSVPIMNQSRKPSIQLRGFQGKIHSRINDFKELENELFSPLMRHQNKKKQFNQNFSSYKFQEEDLEYSSQRKHLKRKYQTQKKRNDFDSKI